MSDDPYRRLSIYGRMAGDSCSYVVFDGTRWQERTIITNPKFKSKAHQPSEPEEFDFQYGSECPHGCVNGWVPWDGFMDTPRIQQCPIEAHRREQPQ